MKKIKKIKSNLIILSGFIFLVSLLTQCTESPTGPSEATSNNKGRIFGGFNVCKVYEYGQCRNNGLAEKWKIDKAGNVTEKEIYYGNVDNMDKYIFKFDSYGNLIEEAIWSGNMCDWKMTYEYNQIGQKIKEYYYDTYISLNTVIECIVFKYDKYSNITEMIYYYPDEKSNIYSNSYWYNIYDNQGNLIEYTQYNGEKFIQKMKFFMM